LNFIRYESSFFIWRNFPSDKFTDTSNLFQFYELQSISTVGLTKVYNFMSSGKSKFYLLPQIHQRALHELYLNRHDSNFVVSEETKAFILQNTQVFAEEFADYERDPHLKDSYSQFTDSSGVEIRLLIDPSRTPPPDTSSESEGEDSPLFVRKFQPPQVVTLSQFLLQKLTSICLTTTRLKQTLLFSISLLETILPPNHTI
jgi:hypothetical protein